MEMSDDVSIRQREEAVKRLKMLKVHPNVIKDFRNGIINYSVRGILFWIEKESWANIISAFEKDYNSVVYHAIINHAKFGDMLSLLYVSQHEKEWELDRQLLTYGETVSYVYNFDAPYCSEIGSIGIKSAFGGIIRTY